MYACTRLNHGETWQRVRPTSLRCPRETLAVPATATTQNRYTSLNQAEFVSRNPAGLDPNRSFRASRLHVDFIGVAQSMVQQCGPDRFRDRRLETGLLRMLMAGR